MNQLLTTIGTHISDNGNHSIYLIDWQLIKAFIKKWSRNREPDQGRIDEIIHFLNSDGYIPSLIHLAELEDEGLVCYDGNHRREAFNKSTESRKVLIDIIHNATQKEVIECFKNINKSVQVPELFFQESVTIKIREEILGLVKQYETNFKEFLSTSARCRTPHFNRDTFIDNIFHIWKEYNGKYTIGEISALLIKLNEAYKDGKIGKCHSIYSEKIIDKCKKVGLWLFIDKTIPFEHITAIE